MYGVKTSGSASAFPPAVANAVPLFRTKIFKMCGFERVQVCGPVSDDMKEMAKEMPFPFELYDHLHDGRFGKLK